MSIGSFGRYSRRAIRGLYSSLTHVNLNKFSLPSSATIIKVERAIRLRPQHDGYYISSFKKRSSVFFRITPLIAGFMLGEFLKTRKLAFFQSRSQKKKSAKAAEKAEKAKKKQQPLFRKGKRIKGVKVNRDHILVSSGFVGPGSLRQVERGMTMRVLSYVKYRKNKIKAAEDKKKLKKLKNITL